MAGERNRNSKKSIAPKSLKIRESVLELQNSEESFRLLVECVQDYAIFMLDRDGSIQSWNLGAERIKGYRAEEVIGKHFSIFYTIEDIQWGKPEYELKVATTTGRFEDLGWRLRKDGSRFWANVVITALRDHAGQLRGFGKVTRDLTERKMAEDEILQSHASQRELSARLLHVQDEERRRIGRELHDSVGQNLVMLKMHLDQLAIRSAPNGALSQKLSECIRLADETINEVRATSYALYPPMLEEMGLKSAVPWFLDGFRKRSGLVTRLDIPPDFGRPPRDVELALFRVLQESLTNVIRHSESKVADVRLDKKDDFFTLEVRDEGIGIPSEVLDAFQHESLGKLGVGLRGMNERIRELGGKLDVSSTPGGTIISVSVPATDHGQTRLP